MDATPVVVVWSRALDPIIGQHFSRRVRIRPPQHQYLFLKNRSGTMIKILLVPVPFKEVVVVVAVVVVLVVVVVLRLTLFTEDRSFRNDYKHTRALDPIIGQHFSRRFRIRPPRP